jgi:hypothetical protein
MSRAAARGGDDLGVDFDFEKAAEAREKRPSSLLKAEKSAKRKRSRSRSSGSGSASGGDGEGSGGAGGGAAAADDDPEKAKKAKMKARLKKLKAKKAAAARAYTEAVVAIRHSPPSAQADYLTTVVQAVLKDDAAAAAITEEDVLEIPATHPRAPSFLQPALAKLDIDVARPGAAKAAPLAIVVCASKEKCGVITYELSAKGISVARIFGNDAQMGNSKVAMAVGTPAKLIKEITQGRLSWACCRAVVVDMELDLKKMNVFDLNDTRGPAVNLLLSRPKQTKILLF